MEDRTFDTHHGFDIKGIARAALVNLREGDRSQGASTLTQQLVRSYFLSNERTYIRKLRELAYAVILEARFTKPDLMNAYVNEIFLGQDGARAIHGFGLGSHFYFNKPIEELDVHELALLVAVIRGPSYYNPFRHQDRVKRRRDRVLGTMLEFGLIDERQHRQALARGLGLVANRRAGRYYPAFMDMVRRELADDYEADTLAGEGLSIFTTLSPRLQDAAQAAVTATLANLERERELPNGSLEAAMVVRASQTGDVRALVAGRVAGPPRLQPRRQRPRQVGSVIKPLGVPDGARVRAATASLADSRSARDAGTCRATGPWSPGTSTTLRGPLPLVVRSARRLAQRADGCASA